MLNGLSLGDFKTHTEALKCADELVVQNQQELGHQEPNVHHDNPLLVKVFYVHGEGKKRTWRQSETKELEGSLDVKAKRQLVDNKLFLEGLGEMGDMSESSSSGVKIESMAWLHMAQAKDALKSMLQETSMSHCLRWMSAQQPCPHQLQQQVSPSSTGSIVTISVAFKDLLVCYIWCG